MKLKPGEYPAQIVSAKKTQIGGKPAVQLTLTVDKPRSRVIRLHEDTLRRLLDLSLPGESVQDVILRLLVTYEVNLK